MPLRDNDFIKHLLAIGPVPVLGALLLALMIYLVVSQHGKDQIMTAKQCTDTDTAASIERLEKAGVIKEDFTRTPATQGMCEEINDRVLLASTPEARALEVERAVQEFRIIRDSMQAADEDLAAGSPAGRVAITPLAFSELPGYQSREEALTAQPTAQDRASSTGAREAIKDGASPEEAYAKAHADGESAGASKPEAAAGAVNAVSIALIDGTIDSGLASGTLAYNTPPTEMWWNDRAEMNLVLRPSTYKALDELEQKIKDLGKNVGASKVAPVTVSKHMKATLVSHSESDESGLDISSITGEDDQPIIAEGDTKWGWNLLGGRMGSHETQLIVEIGLSSQGESQGFRPVEGFDPVSLGSTNVKGTPWQKVRAFTGNNWQWLWGAILVPVAAFLWRRRKRSNKNRVEGLIGICWQWLWTTIVVPVAAFLRGIHKLSTKNDRVRR